MPITTFWKEIEGWTKGVGEEDVAWLGFDVRSIRLFMGSNPCLLARL